MGNFYTQLWIADSDAETCVALMKDLGRRSVVGPSHRHLTPIFDGQCEKQDPGELDSLGLTASARLGSWAIGFLNHDDDLFLARIFYRGEERKHISAGMMGSFDTSGARDLCSALHPRTATFLVALALIRPRLFQIGRHKRLAKLLDLPEWTVGAGYRYIMKGEFNDYPESEAFVRT
ncbi:hypothetical protein [Haloferula sp. BvORR071]|uniref:hypothetical protein n=1 Tax=Haloferula sp. BvORR071 TaxID=1396141 RepID=UPI000550049B|nr:hypothetical protein [Haloferula sp. BvORR071]